MSVIPILVTMPKFDCEKMPLLQIQSVKRSSPSKRTSKDSHKAWTESATHSE